MGKIVSVFLTLFLFVGNAYAASSICSENKSQTDCQQAAKDFADSKCMWYSAQGEGSCYSSSCRNNKTETECKIAATAGKNYCVWFKDIEGHGRTGCYTGFYTSENCPSNAGFRLGCKDNEVIPIPGGVVACIPCPAGQITVHNTGLGYESYTRPFYITCQASTNVEIPYQKSVPWCSTDGSSKEQCLDSKYYSCIDATYVYTQPRVINFYEFPSYEGGNNVVPGQPDGVEPTEHKVMCFLDLPSTNQSDKKQTFEGWLPYDDSNKKCPENTGSNYIVRIGAEETNIVLGRYKKPGYVAVFYYKKTDGTYALIGTVDQNGHTFNDMHSALSNSDITDIYVFWQPKKYCVTYGIKGTNVYSAKISKVCTYGEKCKIISAAVNKEDYNTAPSGDFAVPPGSYISQWKTDDGKTTYEFGEDVDDLANPKNGSDPAEWEAGSSGYYCEKSGTNAGLKLWPVIKKCEPGYYCPGENTYLNQIKCTAGATSDEGAITKYNCYLSGSTKFCDGNGFNCFQISNLGDKKLYPVAN